MLGRVLEQRVLAGSQLCTRWEESEADEVWELHQLKAKNGTTGLSRLLTRQRDRALPNAD